MCVTEESIDQAFDLATDCANVNFNNVRTSYLMEPLLRIIVTFIGGGDFFYKSSQGWGCLLLRGGLLCMRGFTVALHNVTFA